MTPSECGRLLRACAFYDNRKVSDESMIAWSRAINADLNPRDALEAIAAHYSESSDWCMPSHINTRVRAVRRERLQRAGVPPIPGDLDQAQEQAWRELWCASVKDGDDDPVAVANHAMGITAVTELVGMPADVRAAITQFASDHAVPQVSQ